jgi:transposase
MAQGDRARSRLRPDKSATFKTLLKQTQPVAIEPEPLEQQPHSGHVFVFRGRRGDMVKVRSLDLGGKSMKATPHLRHPGSDPDPSRRVLSLRRKIHQARRLSMIARINAKSALP